MAIIQTSVCYPKLPNYQEPGLNGFPKDGLTRLHLVSCKKKKKRYTSVIKSLAETKQTVKQKEKKKRKTVLLLSAIYSCYKVQNPNNVIYQL